MRELSREKQIEVSNIVLNKRGFAFVDLQDNVALDKAIEKLSGMKINGKEISVEHSGEKYIFKYFFKIKLILIKSHERHAHGRSKSGTYPRQ